MYEAVDITMKYGRFFKQEMIDRFMRTTELSSQRCRRLCGSGKGNARDARGAAFFDYQGAKVAILYMEYHIMEQTKSLYKGIEKSGHDLFSYAVDRDDVKALVGFLPHGSGVEPGKVEYELQILRVISVGWAIAYCLQDSPHKNPLADYYWRAVRDLSQGVSSAAGFMIGQDIDYFRILKDRLDSYVSALSRRPDASEPAAVIGPEFARLCGNADDVYVVLSGSRMFATVISRVGEYLDMSGLK